jgi:hypothetical protein
VWILHETTRSKLGIHAQTLGTVLGGGGQAVTRGSFLLQVIYRGAEAAARGAVSCASQVLDRGAQAVARGAARCASHALDRGVQAAARGAACCASHVLDRGA